MSFNIKSHINTCVIFRLSYEFRRTQTHIFGLQYAWTHVITGHGIQVHSVTMESYKFYGWMSLCFNCVIIERLRLTVNTQSIQPGKQVLIAVLIEQ